MSKFNYGGQAVIEGVMMRGKHFWAIAVRKENNEISLKDGRVKALADKYPILGKPIIRGSVALIDSMIFGMQSLTYSANEYGDEEFEPLSAKELFLTFAFAILLSVGLFVVLPAFIIRLVSPHINTNFLLNLTEGLIKITFFILYIIGISFMKDIQRVFQYHGAEHRTINCYESGDELTVENVQKHSRIHSRCGTNFLLIVLFMSAFIFTFFGRPPFFQRIGLHLLLLPLVAGLSYEIIRKAGQDDCHPIFKLIAKPGRALQYLTTKEPDDSQVEVAIASLQAVLVKEAELAGETVPSMEQEIQSVPASTVQ